MSGLTVPQPEGSTENIYQEMYLCILQGCNYVCINGFSRNILSKESLLLQEQCHLEDKVPETMSLIPQRWRKQTIVVGQRGGADPDRILLSNRMSKLHKNQEGILSKFEKHAK